MLAAAVVLGLAGCEEAPTYSPDEAQRQAQDRAEQAASATAVC